MDDIHVTSTYDISHWSGRDSDYMTQSPQNNPCCARLRLRVGQPGRLCAVARTAEGEHLSSRGWLHAESSNDVLICIWFLWVNMFLYINLYRKKNKNKQMWSFNLYMFHSFHSSVFLLSCRRWSINTFSCWNDCFWVRYLFWLHSKLTSKPSNWKTTETIPHWSHTLLTLWTSSMFCWVTCCVNGPLKFSNPGPRIPEPFASFHRLSFEAPSGQLKTYVSFWVSRLHPDPS